VHRERRTYGDDCHALEAQRRIHLRPLDGAAVEGLALLLGGSTSTSGGVSF
jgi:histidine ammonia-lyase